MSWQADSRCTTMALMKMMSAHSRSRSFRFETFTSTSRLTQAPGSMAATVRRPKGGEAARFRMNRRACLRLQNVSGNRGYRSSAFMEPTQNKNGASVGKEGGTFTGNIRRLSVIHEWRRAREMVFSSPRISPEIMKAICTADTYRIKNAIEMRKRRKTKHESGNSAYMDHRRAGLRGAGRLQGCPGPQCRIRRPEDPEE